MQDEYVVLKHISEDEANALLAAAKDNTDQTMPGDAANLPSAPIEAVSQEWSRKPGPHSWIEYRRRCEESRRRLENDLDAKKQQYMAYLELCFD